VIARTGEEIVIGGLIRKEKVHTRRGIPLLMDIPLIGALFSKIEEQELNTEIIFLLRPTVYPTMQHTPRGMFDPFKRK
jgi:type II secretory pathway component GspD/PulD (secretin)